MPIVNMPPVMSTENRVFGCVGVKSWDPNTNTYVLQHRNDGSLFDNAITYVDLIYIEDWFRRKTVPGYTSSISDPLTDVEMVAAGFDTYVWKSEGSTSNKKWNELTYIERDYTTDMWDEDSNYPEGSDITTWENTKAYRYLLMYLSTHMSPFQFGDLNLDNNYTDADFGIFKEFIQWNDASAISDPDYIGDLNPYNVDRYMCLDFLYSKFTPPTPDSDSNKDICNIDAFKSYQTLENGSVSTHLILGGDTYTDRILDIATYKGMLSNIFNIDKFPVNKATLPDSPTGVRFEVRCTKAQSYTVPPWNTTYAYRWELEKDESTDDDIQYDEIQFNGITNEQINSCLIESTLLTTIKPSRRVRLTIYAAKQDNIPEGTSYDDSTYYDSWTCIVMLFVKQPTLWGDSDNNGIVNVLDAYRILNNYSYLKGDVNKDGRIDSKDASFVLSFYSEQSTGKNAQEAVDIININTEQNLTVDDFFRADLDNNGRTDAKDASNILAIYNGLSTGQTYEQLEQSLGITIRVSTVAPRDDGELASLVKASESEPRPSQFNDQCGQLILQSIKNNNIRLY